MHAISPSIAAMGAHVANARHSAALNVCTHARAARAAAVSRARQGLPPVELSERLCLIGAAVARPLRAAVDDVRNRARAGPRTSQARTIDASTDFSLLCAVRRCRT
eukprot:2740920-Pleurochrysis_carterae.AAC.3